MNDNWLDRHHLGFLNLVLYVFYPHSRCEREEVAGAHALKINEIDGLWPRTWLWSRVLVLMLLTTGMLYACWRIEGREGDSALLPGLITVGSLAVPLSVLIFFMEVNKFRSVSLMDALRYLLVGSCVSIAVTLMLTMVMDEAMRYAPRWLDYIYDILMMCASAAFEEFAKTLIIFIFLMQHRNRPYILQGLLVGAAVGVGFSVFESAGYAFIGDGTILQSIIVRGIFSPACHPAWGAIIGGGTMLLCRGRLGFGKLFNPLFSLLYLFVTALHLLWNWLLMTETTLTRNVQLSVVVWFIILMIIWAGICQVRRFKAAGFMPIYFKDGAAVPVC